jgi:alpha-N-arabinofuranosidase
VFLVNRHRTDAITATVRLEDLGGLSIAETHTLSDDDPDAANTLQDQERVQPAPNETAGLDGDVLTVTLPPVSWTAIGLVSRP